MLSIAEFLSKGDEIFNLALIHFLVNSALPGLLPLPGLIVNHRHPRTA